MPAHGTHGALGLSESCMSRAAGGRGWGRRGAGTRRGRRRGSMAMAPDGRSLERRSGGCHGRKCPALPLHRITRCHCQLRARRRPREGRERAALLPRALPAATMSTPERVGRHSALPCRAQLQAADAHSTFLKKDSSRQLVRSLTASIQRTPPVPSAQHPSTQARKAQGSGLDSRRRPYPSPPFPTCTFDAAFPRHSGRGSVSDMDSAWGRGR